MFRFRNESRILTVLHCPEILKRKKEEGKKEEKN